MFQSEVFPDLYLSVFRLHTEAYEFSVWLREKKGLDKKPEVEPFSRSAFNEHI